ncbi:MAG: DUF4143 domain-containing protein [Bdellovibrionota bacterium]
MKRLVKIEKNKNILLLGPRQTGKSTLIKELIGPNDLYINLLLRSQYNKYSKEIEAFHNEVLFHFKQKGASLCIIDEVQKIPALLDEVHDLIECTDMCFILTGSSARKLKNHGVNLLAGRALPRSLFPLIYTEIGNSFDLEKALIYGTLPKIWNDDLKDHEEYSDFLSAYCDTYLKEEIQQEALVRKLDAFSRFLDVAAINDGQIVNYSTIARECGVSAKSVQGFYEILEDTFLAHRIDGWNKSVRKQLVSHPKYYFFDCGVSNTLCHWMKEQLNKDERGRKFEQFVILQLIALNSYHKLNLKFYHWRDKNGLEVDLLITKGLKILAAVEFKSNTSVHMTSDTKALTAFLSENGEVPCYVVVPTGNPRELQKSILYYHWKEFIETVFLALGK